MAKRLLLAEPKTNGVGTEFPYVDVRPVKLISNEGSKSGGLVFGGYVLSSFTAILELSFYRLGPGGERILLEKDYQPLRRLFEVAQRIKDPGVGTDQLALLYFWDYIFFGTTPAQLASFFPSTDVDDFRYQFSAGNPFEEIHFVSPPDIETYYPMINCLAVLLRLEGGGDFAGLTVEEV